MNKFNKGDRVKVICQCDVLGCKPYHDEVGVIGDELCGQGYEVQLKHPNWFFYRVYRENGLIPVIKEIIKNELKGMLE